MDTTTLSNWADFLIESQQSRQIVFGHEHPLVAELSGLVRTGDNGQYVYTRDPNQERFTKAMDTRNSTFGGGSKFTVPLQLSDVSSQATAEGGTYMEPAPFDTDKASYNLKSRHTPIGLTLELERDAKNGSTSALESVAGLLESAYRAAATADENFLHGDGTALLQAATSANSDADGLVMTVGTTANFDRLTPGRIVDIRVIADGTDPGQGKRRKIKSVSRSAGTVTFDTAQVASDGGSGNITLSTNNLGIYVDSSSGTVAPHGLGSVVSATDTTYGGIDKTAVPQWKGVQVDAGGGTLSDDSISEALYYLRGNGVGAPDFGMAHPLTANPYADSKTSLVVIQAQTTMVPSGFKGVVCQLADQEFPILKALAAPRGVCRLVTKSSMRIYGDSKGPALIDDDGSQWRFFSRSTKKEADLFDRWELGARDCAKNAEITNLSE